MLDPRAGEGAHGDRAAQRRIILVARRETNRLATEDDLDFFADVQAPVYAAEDRSVWQTHATAVGRRASAAAAQPVGAPDKAGDEAVGRPVINVLRRAELLHDALIEYANLIG